ncbi:protein tyrosine phosphatase receptor type C-associated protein [Porphyrio hochstetteri]
MAGAWRCSLVPGLLALAGVAAAAKKAPLNRNDWTAGALAVLLLLLATGLAVAWRHLCLLDGRYHPRPLGRRALALLRECWYQLRGAGGLAGEPCPRDGVLEAAPRDEEEELMPWSQGRRMEEDEDEEEEEEEKEQEEDEEEEEEEAAEAAAATVAVETGESPPSGGQVAGGSAEALLSDLHSFSGTAAWGDARPNVTAL